MGRRLAARGRVADVKEKAELGVDGLAGVADGRGQGVVGAAAPGRGGRCDSRSGRGSGRRRLARGDHLGDQAAHLQALEGHQAVEVGEGDLAHEPVDGLLALLGRGLGRVGHAHAAQFLGQGRVQALAVGHGRVVGPQVGQLVGLDPAAAGKTVAFELDGDVVLQAVAQLEDEGFDGAFGWLVHRFTSGSGHDGNRPVYPPPHGDRMPTLAPVGIGGQARLLGGQLIKEGVGSLYRLYDGVSGDQLLAAHQTLQVRPFVAG